MPHDGTNHPWYQGFTDMFGSLNTGLQNAMNPSANTVGTPNNDYYNYLTQSLNVSLLHSRTMPCDLNDLNKS